MLARRAPFSLPARCMRRYSIVPQHDAPPHPLAVLELAELIRGANNLLVLTGAGISTEAGIPAYRTPGAPPYRPLQHKEFEKSYYTRQRYWARSMVGHHRMSTTQPSITHYALAALEREGVVHNLITQNVDSLHYKAGSGRVLELHGALRYVECMDCDGLECRDSFQQRLMVDNGEWFNRVRDHDGHADRPDFDVELDGDPYASFHPAPCTRCGGRIKPGVVFHGGHVPREVSAYARDLASSCDAMLVLGSSLPVQSSLSLVRTAAKTGTPVGIVNIGDTRGDPFAQFKLDTLCSAVMERVLDHFHVELDPEPSSLRVPPLSALQLMEMEPAWHTAQAEG